VNIHDVTADVEHDDEVRESQRLDDTVEVLSRACLVPQQTNDDVLCTAHVQSVSDRSRIDHQLNTAVISCTADETVNSDRPHTVEAARELVHKSQESAGCITEGSNDDIIGKLSLRFYHLPL